MRTILLTLACAFTLYGQAQTTLLKSGKSYACVVRNSSKLDLKDMPVIFSLPQQQAADEWIVEDASGKLIPFQIDDLQHDGIADELVFLVDLNQGEKKSFVIRPDRKGVSCSFTSRVHAQMYMRNADKSITSVTTATSPTGDLYEKLHHHGPAFESELIAYRLYFDRKQTVDVYGKKQKRLELDASKWYPTDEQLANNFGDDILRVSGSVGVGTLKGWDAQKKKALHIETVNARTATIISRGPLRTIVEMVADNWQYAGRSIQLTSRYILYAGHRDVEVIHKLQTPNPQELILATGVQKMDGDQFYSNKKGTMAMWGTDWPVNDTIKYAKETVGLAVSLPEGSIIGQTEDKVNHLYLFHPDAKGEIAYRFLAAWQKEQFGVKTGQQFFTLAEAIFSITPACIEVDLKEKT